MLKGQAQQKPKINQKPQQTIGGGIKQSFKDLLSESSERVLKELKEFPPEIERQLGIKEAVTFFGEQQTLVDLDEERKLKEAERKEAMSKQEIFQVLNQISIIQAKEEQKEKIEIEQTIEVAYQAAKENKIDTKIGLLRFTSFGPIAKSLIEKASKEIFKRVQDSKDWSMAVFKRNVKRPRGMLIWTQDQKRVTESGATMLQG